MNRARPKRKILLVLTCAIALLALVPVTQAAGGDGVKSEPQPAALSSVPVDAAVTDETPALHAQAVRGLPFSNFDLFALIAVLVGLSSISYVVHRLNRDPAEPAAEAPITTDAA